MFVKYACMHTCMYTLIHYSILFYSVQLLKFKAIQQCHFVRKSFSSIVLKKYQSYIN